MMKKIDKLFDNFNPKVIERQKIFFLWRNIDAFQSYSLIIELIKEVSNRIIIIDNTLYHLGASLKDLGKKCFAINKIEDKEYLEKY